VETDVLEDGQFVVGQAHALAQAAGYEFAGRGA